MSLVPAELRVLPQWILWRREHRDGRATKVPYCAADPSSKASTADPATWDTFEHALAAAACADGIGYVFTIEDDFVGVDLDQCVNPGRLHPEAKKIVDLLGSYTEYSPSCTGVHVIVRAKLKGARNRTGSTPWGGHFEAYERGRYFTITGDRLAGTPGTIEERQGQLDKVCDLLLPAGSVHGPRLDSAEPASEPVNGSPLSINDEHLIRKAREARNGHAFGSLWRGDFNGYPSSSEADLALCGLLAFWTGPDPERIDRLFRRSGLLRDKWDERRGDTTYGAQTIATALQGRTEFYEPGRGSGLPRGTPHDAARATGGRDHDYERPPQSTDGRYVKLTSSRAIRSERVRWLWTGRVPLRGLTVVAGEKGLGKSILTNAWLAAKLTRGELEGELADQPVDVLIATAEDDWSSVIKPRLMAHGADLDHVHRVEVHDKGGRSLLTLPDDVALLEQKIDKLRDADHTVGMIVIDPIGAFLADRTDSHKDAPVRRALAPLAALAERLDLAVVVVAHLTKDDARKLIARVSGAGAFVNAARSVLAFARDPGDPGGEQGHERVLVHVGTNWGRYAPSLAARIESRLVDVDDGSRADVGYLVVIGETNVGVDDLQRGADEDGSDCEALIGVALTEGARPSHQVKEEVAGRLGCARKTVERHAVRMAERGELIIESGGFPRTTIWRLASRDSGPENASAVGTDANFAAGTSLDANCVPTSSRALQSGFSASSRDSRDTRGVSYGEADWTKDWSPL